MRKMNKLRFQALLLYYLKNCSLIVLVLAFGYTSSWSQVITIGSGTSTQRYPLGNYYGYERSAALYLSSEINAIGIVDSIGWEATAISSSHPIKIYLATTASNTLTNSSFSTFASNATLVFDGTLPTTTGWNSFALSTPYIYMGGNLIVLVEDNYGGSGDGGGSTGSKVYYTSGQTDKHIYWQSDNTPPSSTGTINDDRPNVKLVLSPLVACSGQPDAGAIASAASFGVCQGDAFSLSDTGFTIGGGMTMQWQERSPAGTGTWQDISGANSTSLSIANGITQATDYRFYIVCNSSALSDTSSPVSATINPITQCYCIPSFTYPCSSNDYIDNFSLSGENNTSIADIGTGCSTGNYDDQTTQAPVDLLPTSTYIINISSGTSGDYCAVWIDFDDDGSFQGSEKVGYSGSISTSSSGTDFDISIPGFADTGSHRMRVFLGWSGDPSDADDYDPCNAGSYPRSYGEVHDYIVHILPPPSCIAPDANSLTATAVGSTTATINWDASVSNPSNGYEYYFNTTGVAPSATTTASGSATDTFANLTSLTPNTVYYAWVRSICSSTDTSNWSASATIFQTPCASSVTPWSYDVETASTTTSADIDDCWSTDPEGTTTSYRWNVDGSGSTPSLNTGPSGANSGSNYFYTEASNGSTGDTAFLRTPNVDISNLTLGALKFYYHMYGQTMGDLYVQVSTNGGTTWTTVDSIIGEQQTSENDPWLERMVLLNGYSGTISVRFAAVRGSDYYSDMSLDDISIEEAPTCLPPTIFSIEDIQTNSADIAWEVPLIVPGTGYEYYYNATGNDPSAGTTASGSVTDTFANLTGLSQNTTYYVWVRSVCNSTDKSDWSAPAFVFTTLCTTADVPYVVPMATATPSATPPGLPDCMSDEALNPNDPEGWYATTGSPGSSNGFTGNYFQSDYTGSSDGDVDNWIYTNKVNMIPGVNYKISFKYGNNSSSFTEKLALAYGTAATADSMTTILFDDTSIQLAGSTDTNVYFTVPAAGTYYFGFHAHSDANEYYLFLSDISVDSLPTCHVANSLVANNITTNSADLAWFGTALKYRIEYGESGFTLGTGTQVSTNSGTYQLTGLDPNTTYDFYVKDVCVPGVDSADWSAVETFTTLCNVPSVNVGHDTSFCEGGQITLYTGNADTNSTVLWSTGATADSIVVNSYGEYYATITNEFDCSAADTVFVNVKPYPVVDLGTDTSICGNNTVVLDAGTQPLGTTFFWNTAATSQTITVADSGWYKVIADNVGCVTIDSVHVSKQEMPNVTGITGTSENADCTFDFVAINPEHVTDYYWDFGDGSNATGTTPTHTYSNNGSYDVTLIVSNECGTDSVVTAVNCSDLGIGQLDLNNEQLKLYPNPARDRITLQNESVYQMKTITVYNVLGQVIFNGKADATDRYTLNVQSYASGIYNVKITFKNGSWIQRKFEIRK